MTNKTISELDSATLSDSLVMVVEGQSATEKTTVGALKEYVGQGKQDTLTAGNNITITNNVISATATPITVDQVYNPSSTNPQSGVAVSGAISAAISAVYKPAGSCAFANLPELSNIVLGNVYNVSDSFTTDNRFVDGTGKTYPAGTNVVVVEIDSSYKFDVLTGLVDLSDYATIASLATVATSGSYEDLSNKPAIPAGVTVDQVYDGTSTNAVSGVAIAGASFQTTGNLVTSLSASSTDVQYPSAKCVYDMIGDIETVLATI